MRQARELWGAGPTLSWDFILGARVLQAEGASSTASRLTTCPSPFVSLNVNDLKGNPLVTSQGTAGLWSGGGESLQPARARPPVLPLEAGRKRQARLSWFWEEQ